VGGDGIWYRAEGQAMAKSKSKVQVATRKRRMTGYPQKRLKTMRRMLQSPAFDQQSALKGARTEFKQTASNLGRTF
jgi:hypothetical protein